jgi:23S rRNA pseudouridine2605 synthase
MATKKAARSAKTGEPKTKPTKQKAKVTPRKAKAAPETEIPEATPSGGIGAPAGETVDGPIIDPIGDTTDGEARTSLADEVPAEVAAAESAEAELAKADDGKEAEPEFTPAPRPPAKLERLQKILSQAGVASRRKAEEMIEQGRVQVNGTVVTALGTKADANRDHIRVDGKLLHGAERLRYFVLNKPKGFVTTVKDPEGRPTVMQFFDKMRERLYPVGRLDYMSEGLLLVTNDGDLANKLTKAGSGVEKVYLVKVAGQPTEAELELLRAGVSIERGKPGSPQVRTSPARIRQVRQGDNPWYEVVLIEGRNRELRKMFVAVGHFVEKIRRVGYGPLVLDQEPGNMRELEPEELAKLRLAAEGKLRTPKAKEVRRRNLADGQLPTVRPKPSHPNPKKPFEAGKLFETRKPIEPGEIEARPTAAERTGAFRPRPPYGKDQPFRPARPTGEGFRPARSFSEKPAWKKDDRAPRPPARFTPGESGEGHPPAAKRYGDRPAAGRAFGSKPTAGRTFGSKPAGRPFAGKPAPGKPNFGKPAFSKRAWKKPDSGDRPASKRPTAPGREASPPADDFVPFKPGSLRIDPIEPGHADTRGPDARGPRTFSKPPARPSAGRPPFDRPHTGKPAFRRSGVFEKPRFEKPRFDKPKFEKPGFERSGSAQPRFEKPRLERPSAGKPKFDGAGSGRPGIDARTGAPYRAGAGPARSARPPRAEDGLGRPFTTSSGKPRAGGARPSSKPFKPGGHSSSKPRPGGFSKPKPGGFSKSGPKGAGFKGKPGGKKHR